MAPQDAAAPVENLAPAVSADAVSQMQQRFREKLKKLVADAMGETQDREKAQALFHYAYRLRHARQKVTKGILAEAAEQSAADILAMARRQPKAYPMDEATALIRNAEGKHKTRHGHMFSRGQHRRYYKMPAPSNQNLGRLGRDIVEWLEGKGYSNIDYIAGTCTDERKQTRRIGRILPEHVKQDFANDPQRQGSNMYVVISRHPYDVIRMSTLRGWQSCMTRNGMYFDYVPKDVKAGTMVAYLVSASDPEILDPMARVAIKPYHNGKGETIMMAGPTYGIASETFKQTVQAALDRDYNAKLFGDFRIDGTVYDDGMRQNERRIPDGIEDWNTDQWIDFLGLEIEQKDGQRIIKGDLVLNNYNLAKLPDFSTYVVTGHVDVSGNKLENLHGAPRQVEGSFNAGNNQLTTLAGGPESVGTDFNIVNNKLTNLLHGPKTVGRSYSAQHNELISLAGAPEQITDSFLVGKNKLRSLDGAPKSVGMTLDLSSNSLKTLVGIPQIGSQQRGGELLLRDNLLESLHGLPARFNGSIVIQRNPYLRDLKGAPQHVTGVFEVQECGLISLEGAPREVGGHAMFGKNRLTSLKGAPARIGGQFSANGNALANLDGMPTNVGAGIYLNHCELTSLQGMPEKLSCGLSLANNQLTSLTGMPREIKGDLNLSQNRLQSLEGIAQVVAGSLNLSQNRLISTRGITQKIGGGISLNNNHLTRFEDMPQHIGGTLLAMENRLVNTAGLPQVIEGDLVLRNNPLEDATQMPRRVIGYVDLRRVANLRHLPARLPENCHSITTDHRRYYERTLPCDRFPPNGGTPNAKGVPDIKSAANAAFGNRFFRG